MRPRRRHEGDGGPARVAGDARRGLIDPLDTALSALSGLTGLGHLGVEPLSVAVDDVDLVRETTRVSVRYTVNDPWWLWADADRTARRADAIESDAADAG